MEWPLNRRPRPAFPAVIREPAGRDLVDEARIAELDEQVYRAHRLGRADERDRLIDLRNAIRPARPTAVPVIPGRAT
jgi:hypothetical protein